ncbi:MAG TPA: acyl-CoA dehydrogenase family protein [Polyangiales bacterium]|nr:acyl-CoA dehydrogenase family protein [Polyangiales bacterium]
MTEPNRYVETTHKVENQALPLEPYDAYQADAALREGCAREGGAWLNPLLSAYGVVAGSAESAALGAQANQYPPQLRSHDRYGHRIDEVEYHPAYHELMRLAMQHGVHSLAWTHSGGGGHVAHAALIYLQAQFEAGTCCPLTMTHASVPSLRQEPSLAEHWLPKLLAADYDRRCLPLEAKLSATIGMAMTEKQGGSDVRANTTRAVPLSDPGPGRDYQLTGHKWFCSAPMSDAFLTLAQTGRGLSCFLVPRWWHDGSRNRFLIQRLKDKLGNRSNASSEIEYDRTLATLIGEEGRGVATIMPMVAQTRLDCAAGSAGLMRQAVVQAIAHTQGRAAFGRRLIEQPLMLNVLADLALEAEAALVLSLRVARSFDQAANDPAERALSRVATALAKYWVTRRTPRLVFEAMECLGGAGYVEESVLPRLYRESPLNSIWEGSGNVQCLDLLRSLLKEPDALAALLREIELSRGLHAGLDQHVAQLKAALHDNGVPAESRARRWVEDLALALAASLLLRCSPGFVAEAYCNSRLGGTRGLEYGGLPDGTPLSALVERALS